MVVGLTPVMPSGALYMMVGVELDKFPHITTAVDFMEKLMLEESVYILPGEVCNALLPTVCKLFFPSCSVSNIMVL